MSAIAMAAKAKNTRAVIVFMVAVLVKMDAALVVN
jgi:hypothetical protein